MNGLKKIKEVAAKWGLLSICEKSVCYNARIATMEINMKCECLFCDEPAVARFTAPTLKPRHFVCEDHLAEQLAWAAPYRQKPGRVAVEPLAR